MRQETKLKKVLVNSNHKEKRKEKKKPKAGNREKKKKLRKKKTERDFNINISNMSVKVKVISFNEKGQLSKFYWQNMNWSTIEEIENLNFYFLTFSKNFKIQIYFNKLTIISFH